MSAEIGTQAMASLSSNTIARKISNRVAFFSEPEASPGKKTNTGGLPKSRHFLFPHSGRSAVPSLLQTSINVRAIAQGCSEYNIIVVVKREDCIKALRAVHSRFYLSRTTIAMSIIAPGVIGSTLLEQREQATLLKEEFNIDLRVLGITGSRSMLLSEI